MAEEGSRANCTYANRQSLPVHADALIRSPPQKKSLSFKQTRHTNRETHITLRLLLRLCLLLLLTLANRHARSSSIRRRHVLVAEESQRHEERDDRHPTLHR